MKISTTRRAVAAALVIVPMWASAQSGAWPARPVRAVVPFAAGAATDIVARAVLEQVSRQIGQPIVIENRPGAGGTIGVASVARAEPDGYTVLVHSNSYTVSRYTYRNLSYDPATDLIGVAPLTSVPMVLVTSPSRQIRSIDDLLKLARAKDNAITYASAGTGGVTHLGAERLRIAGGYTATHVPYKSSGEALNDVVAGRVDYYYSPVGMAVPLMQSDKLVALAVSSSSRSAALPEVPTMREAGLPNADYDVWIGMFAPARTPREIIDRLNAEVNRALRSPELAERFRTLVMNVIALSVDQFNEFLKRDFQMNAELVQAARIEPN